MTHFLFYECFIALKGTHFLVLFEKEVCFVIVMKYVSLCRQAQCKSNGGYLQRPDIGLFHAILTVIIMFV